MARSRSIALAVLLAMGGCSSPVVNHIGEGAVFGEIGERTAAPECFVNDSPVDASPWVEFQDGLSADEAASLALTRNARFQELLADLGLTWADLVIAGQLTNPQLTTLFPVSSKDFEFTLQLPLEILLTRPRRIDAAMWQSRKIGMRLVQDGLNVVRDAKLAHADAWVAVERSRLAELSARLRERTAGLTRERERGGEASALDVSTARLDALAAQEAAMRLAYDAKIAGERLRMVIGAGEEESMSPFELTPAPAIDGDGASIDAEALVREALANRPDMAAATLAVNEAEARARLALYDGWFARLIAPDINSPGGNGFEVGPGLQMILPIFHQNQGARARACAEVERLARQRETLHDTIVFEVRTAAWRVEQAQTSLRQLKETVLPLAATVASDSEVAFREGAQSLIMTLDNNRRLLDMQLRLAESEAEGRRAAAELERAVGHRLPTMDDNDVAHHRVDDFPEPVSPAPSPIDADELPAPAAP